MKVESGDVKERRYRITPLLNGITAFDHKADIEKDSSFREYYDREAISMLFRELDEVGIALSRYPSKGLINKYKSLVRQVIGMILENMRVKKEFAFSLHSNKMYTIIERTEKSIAELEEALDKEREKIVILNIVEEIKGCLISLLL